MAKKIPTKLRNEVFKSACEKADAHNYLRKDRVANGQFIDNLVVDPDVGKRLSEYKTKDRLRTYIKDTLLNRYAKQKINTEVPRDVDKYIESVFNRKSFEISYKSSDRVSLHRFDESQDLLIVARGTYIKWETAIRKALEYISACPGVPSDEGGLEILLVITTTGRVLTNPDKTSLTKALDLIGIKLVFFDEI